MEQQLAAVLLATGKPHTSIATSLSATGSRISSQGMYETDTNKPRRNGLTSVLSFLFQGRRGQNFVDGESIHEMRLIGMIIGLL